MRKQLIIKIKINLTFFHNNLFNKKKNKILTKEKNIKNIKKKNIKEKFLIKNLLNLW